MTGVETCALPILGYVDSGMMGEPTNDDPASFWQADTEHAARRLALILEEEQADVLTYYDEIGGYGHPDHIKVHQVGRRAGELAETPKRYMATMNRDEILRRSRDFAPEDADPPDLGEDFGTPEAELTTAVDVSPYVTYKRQAMRAHASQISDQSFFLTLPDDVFAVAFGTEYFIRVGAPPGIAEADLFD